MRFIPTFVLVLSAFVFAIVPRSWSSEESDYLPLASEKAGGIVDLALIYQGGTHRIPWTSEQFRPYLTWTDPETKKEEWLFDGFLFIEFQSAKGEMYAKGYGRKPATKEDWLWYLDRVFAPDLAIHALDKELAQTIKRLGQPPRPRKVVLTVPEPIVQTENWGELDGKPLDFTDTNDRIAATKWFIDQLLKRWEEGKFQYLELAGFYWVAEEMGDSDQQLIQATGNYIRSKQTRFFWIPWWNSPGSRTWKQLGFDAAYQQPNYFFVRYNHPETHVSTACDFAKSQGMGMEMEWDSNLFNDTENFAPRFVNYVDSFAQKGVWDRSAVAHYMGGHGMIEFQKSEVPQVRELYNRYCKILSQRQKQTK